MTEMKGMVLAAALACSATGDVVVAYWNFGMDAAGYTENVSVENTVGTPVLSVFKGEGYQISGAAGTDFTDEGGMPVPPGQALAWASGVNDGQYWLVDIDLSGYRDLSIRWDYRSTSSGPSSADLEYKTGDVWHPAGTVLFSRDSEFHEYSEDLSACFPMNNCSSVQIRLSNFGGGSGSGTIRMDNLLITGSVIPEPATAGLATLAGLVIFIIRKISAE